MLFNLKINNNQTVVSSLHTHAHTHNYTMQYSNEDDTHPFTHPPHPPSVWTVHLIKVTESL